MIGAATEAVLVISAAIPRALGVEDYGRYAAIMAVVSILQVVSAAGLPLVEARHVAPLWHSGRAADATVLASTIWTSRLLLSSVAGALVAAWLAMSGNLLTRPALLLAVAVQALLRCAFEASRSLLVPLGHVGRYSLLDFLRASFTLLVVLAVFPRGGLGGVLAALPAMYCCWPRAAVTLLAARHCGHRGFSRRCAHTCPTASRRSSGRWPRWCSSTSRSTRSPCGRRRAKPATSRCRSRCS